MKKAYKELAKLQHPDRETGNLERFQAISKAW
ncbi:MAG: DnaJ domain-containing protein [Acidobacteria bacterium]|nr:DnaJ domain-containing protein [Acidobacteriota bacterium]